MVRNLIIAFLLLLRLFCSAQNSFQKIYSGQGYFDPNATLQTKDGGYIIAGTVCNCGKKCGDASYTCNHIFLIKTNNLGDTLWTRTYEDTLNDILSSIKQTNDGGLIIAGTIGVSPGGGNLFLLKLDRIGNVVWLRNYFDGSGGSLFVNSINLTLDGGFAIACTLESFNISFNSGYSDDVYLIKTDSLGTIVWENRTNYTAQSVVSINCSVIKQTFDGGYICSINEDPINPFISPCIMKLNSNGDTLWTKSLSIGHEILNIYQASDSGYFIEGDFYQKPGVGDVFVCKVNKNGISQWAKKISNLHQEFSSAYPTTDGGYVISGYMGISNNNISLITINNVGDSLWTVSYPIADQGGNPVFSGNAIQQTMDKGFIFVGQTIGIASSTLIKTDSLGHAGCNEVNATGINDSSITNITTPTHFNWSIAECLYGTPIVFAVGSGPDTVQTICSSTGMNELRSNRLEFIVFPNPSSKRITIQLSQQSSYPLTIQLINLLGQPVFTQSNIQSPTFTLDVSTLPKSMYFVQVREVASYLTGWQPIVVE